MTAGAVLDARSMRARLAKWMEWMLVRRYSARTVDTTRRHVEQFAIWCDTRGLVRPEEITKPILERYQRFLFHYRKKDGRPLSYSSQAGKLVAVRGMFRWLARQNAILWNPAADLDLPRPEYRLPKHVLTITEIEKVIAAPDVRDPLGLRDRAIVETLHATAMRRSELVGLSVYDVDTERQTVRIRRGKGDKERIVPIGERALAWIGKYVDVVRPELVVTASEQALFLTRLGDPFTPDALTDRVRKIVSESEVGKKGACHMFRHTAATLMLEGGADIRYVQQMLGHSKLETTEIYTHVSITKLREVYAATHPAAKLGRSAAVRVASPAAGDAAELLADLAAEAGEEAEAKAETPASTSEPARSTLPSRCSRSKPT
jgi:integrase/recombinase XerD